MMFRLCLLRSIDKRVGVGMVNGGYLYCVLCMCTGDVQVVLVSIVVEVIH